MPNSNDLTIEQFQKVMPKGMKKTITNTLIASINKTLTDPALHAEYRNNLLSYTSVMQDGKFKIQQYLDAVRYVGFKLLGSSNIDAYVKTFPARYQYFINNKTTEKDISSYVCSYNKNKLVNLIFEQTMIPTHILNADLYQKAINKQASIMANEDASFKVQSEAANYLMTALKPPEVKKVELDISITEDKTIEDLRRTTLALAEVQHNLLASGAMNAKQIAHSKLVNTVEAEFEEIV